MTKRDKLTTATIIAMCMGSSLLQPVVAAPSTDIAPDVVANAYEENQSQFASVVLNGKELLTFRADIDDHSAEEKAEDLADKIKDLIQDDKFDPSKLLPAKEGDYSVVKLDGSTVFKFSAAEMINGAKPTSSNPLDQSFKVVNSIRQALGAAPVPASFMKMTDIVSAPAAAMAKAGANVFTGFASWYGGKFHGRKTSDGRVYDQDGLTAAHRSLPFGTKLLVMNKRTGDSCVVEVNDRGPFVGDRVIDLSRGAAKQLNMISSGVAQVDCLVISSDTTQ